MSKMSNLLLSDMFFHAPDAPKLARTPMGSLRRSPDTLVGGGERHSLPIPFSQSTPAASRSGRPRRLGCQATNTAKHKFLAMPMCLIAA